jgi:hypothetical protein
MTRLFGYKPDPAHTERFVEALPYPHLAEDLPKLMRQATARDVFLWEPMKAVQPNWERGAQGIGDCVAWGASLAATMLLWQLAFSGDIEFEAEAAPEAIYGGCRVEVNGGRSPLGNSDGAAGSWAADWLKKWGVLLQKDYSQVTGNPDHDLRQYSPKRAKDWGSSGCGGRSDKEALDDVAKQYPIRDVTQVRTVEEVEAAIDAGCPVTIASSAGFDGPRDSEGIMRITPQWPHQMMIAGKRYTPAGQPLFRVFNSWGKSASGPDPGIDHEAVSACSWWIVPEDLQRILREDDSFAFSKVEGFALPPFNFAEDLLG